MRVEFDGQTQRPTQAYDGFPRCRSRTSRVFQSSRQDIQRFGDLPSGQIGAQAVVHPAAEGQYRRRPLTGDVDTIGIVVDGRIAIGRSGIHQHHGASRKDIATEFDVVDHEAKGPAGDRRVAHGLLHRVHGSSGLSLSSSH